MTLIAGALVTSKNAGMAFRDWPHSDGQFMLTYPWLKDFATDWDKFLEHGHRLAGVLIGIWAIGLVWFVSRGETSRSARWLSRSVLIGVILQGLLGGFRVQLDERGLAMMHGAFAAVVVSLMGATATLLSPGWNAIAETVAAQKKSSGKESGDLLPGSVRKLALVLPVLLITQFLLGGMIRHHGRGLHEHLGVGILAGLVMIVNAVLVRRTSVIWIRKSARALLIIGLLQIGLGIGSWITKFGLATFGYVAVADSIGQVIVRSSHTVIGVMLVMTSVIHALRVGRVSALQRSTHLVSGAGVKATHQAALSSGGVQA